MNINWNVKSISYLKILSIHYNEKVSLYINYNKKDKEIIKCIDCNYTTFNKQKRELLSKRKS